MSISGVENAMLRAQKNDNLEQFKRIGHWWRIVNPNFSTLLILSSFSFGYLNMCLVCQSCREFYPFKFCFACQLVLVTSVVFAAHLRLNNIQ